MRCWAKPLNTVPYVTLAIVVVGTWWRYRYDKFGWTTCPRSAYGVTTVANRQPDVSLRHPCRRRRPRHRPADPGVLDRRDRDERARLPRAGRDARHDRGITTPAGAALLIYRRRTCGPVFMATTVNDKIGVRRVGAGHRRRPYAPRRWARRASLARPTTTANRCRWFRSIWVLQPAVT